MRVYTGWRFLVSNKKRVEDKEGGHLDGVLLLVIYFSSSRHNSKSNTDTPIMLKWWRIAPQIMTFAFSSPIMQCSRSYAKPFQRLSIIMPFPRTQRHPQ